MSTASCSRCRNSSTSRCDSFKRCCDKLQKIRENLPSDEECTKVGNMQWEMVVSYCDSKCGCDAWVKLVLVSGCCEVDTGISRKLRGPGRTGSRSKGALELSISRWNRSVCWLCVSSCCLKNIAKYHSKILFLLLLVFATSTATLPMFSVHLRCLLKLRD